MWASVFLLLSTAQVPCVRSGTRCAVPVQVGYGRLRLVVDTGADVTMLGGAAAARAGLRVGPQTPKIRLRGINGTSWASLHRATVRVGQHEEKDVLIAVDPKYRARDDGLLGMSFMERFRVRLDGGRAHFEPIDARARERRGGRGRRWWRLRFRSNQKRLRRYERLLPRAEAYDRTVEAQFGVASDGENVTSMLKRLRAFQTEEAEKLRNDAARHSVPLDWRR